MPITRLPKSFRERPNIKLASRIYGMLSTTSKKRIKAIVPIYVSLAFLDLLGVILLASCGTIAFNLVSGDTRPSRVELFIRKYLSLDIDSGALIFTFAVVAALFLILKTLLNAVVNYRMIKWMANQESIFSTNLFASLLKAPLSEIRKIGVGDAQWAIMIGSSRIISGVVAPLVTVLGDLISILVLLSTLILATPEVTFMLIFLLILSQRFYSYWLRGRLSSYGHQASDKGAALNEEIIQSFNAVKEIKIYSLTDSINRYFTRERNVISTIGQKSSFLNNLFRYYLETIILFSTFFVVAFELYTSDLRRALTSLVLFMSVGLRIIPSLQRLQAITMSLQLSQGMTKTYFAMTTQLQSLSKDISSDLESDSISGASKLGIRISNLSYFVNGEHGSQSILNKINLEILPGSFVVIIGPSGSGKTTLVDLISGLLEPQLGSITFVDTTGNESPSHRQLVGYCSQNPYIFDSDVEENLRIAQTSIEPNSIQVIIDKLNLDSLSRTSQSKNEVSFSRRISGGERQRIGIARAFLSNRPILVFDEPTSALDKENVSRFLEILEQNRGMTTQIVVTHDLQVAEKCDLLIVLDDGSIGYSGEPNNYLKTKS